MKDNRLLKVLWGIVLAIFLCSALFIGISYFTGGDNSTKKKITKLLRHHQAIKIRARIKIKKKTALSLNQKRKAMRKNIERITILIVKVIHLLQTHLINQKAINQVMLTNL